VDMGPTHQFEVLCVHLPRPLLRVVICAEEWTVCAAPGSQVGQFITVLGHFFLTLLHGLFQRGGAMATMSDIAREAGVSLSTVSYALSGKRAISESTRERINAAITRLSYHPHAGARALASQRAGAIGLAVPLAEDVDAHVVMMFVRSLMRAAHQASSEVLLVTGEDHEATLRVLAEGKVDALVVMDVVEDDPRITELATALAVTQLRRRGAHRLVMIGSPSATQTRHATYADRATRGFRTACQNLGVSAHHLVHDHEVESTGQLVRTILADIRPDAL